jgi:hypothetical protein
MARADAQKLRIRKVEKPLQRLNGLFNDFLDTVSGPNAKRERELERISDEIDEVIYDDIKELTKFTGDDISVYLVKLFNDQDATRNSSAMNNGQVKNMEELFSEESGSGIFSFFHDRYKNQNLLYEDLSVVCSQLFELKEALNTTRDAIVTSDDISTSVSHSLNFRNQSDDKDRKGLIDTVDNVQKKFDLLQRLKNHIIPNTLQYGKYYVYTVPYSKLFEQHLEKKEKREAKFTNTLESVNNVYSSVVLESFTEDFANGFKTTNESIKDAGKKEVKDSFNGVLNHVSVFNHDIGIPIMEGIDLDALFDTEFGKNVKKVMEDQRKNEKNSPVATPFADGTSDVKSTTAANKDFSQITDCYVKLIDPRKLIPIKILDQTIGYYYVHQTNTEVSRSPFSQTVKASFTTGSAKDLETNFLSKITDKIVKAFDKKYLEENLQFKELILNSLIFNDIYKREIKFQFIPVDYITEFHVNKDENGEGQSVIMPALFYAKLYLSLLIFKMLTIITRSNDTKVYYVKQSGIDQNVSNKVQEVARSIKERQINFMDLLNYNSMISKIGQAKDIFMPIGRSGEKGIDFDILAGQDVQLNSDLMEMLRSNYINSTGVPSVVMSYVNEADYAKTLVMANAKFIGRVVGYQIDFNDCTTQLYKKILKFSSAIDPEVIDNFEFKLIAPRSLNSTNMSDLISNADVTINMMIKAVAGEQSDQSPTDNIVKDILYRKYAKELLPMLPWSRAEDLLEEARIEAVKIAGDKATAAAAAAKVADAG